MFDTSRKQLFWSKAGRDKPNFLQNSHSLCSRRKVDCKGLVFSAHGVLARRQPEGRVFSLVSVVGANAIECGFAHKRGDSLSQSRKQALFDGGRD